jgi:hypothetical protein
MTRINRAVLRAALACMQLCVALPPSAAQAARPMITDDARIVDPRACQLETWVRRNEASTEQWAIPACNPTGNLELAVGGARTLDSGTARTSDVLVQAKTILKPLETNGWGLGLAVGNLRHPGEQPRGDFARNLYGYVPLSLSYADDLAIVHFNLGMLRQENESRHLVTAGVGAEIRLHPRLFLIPEVFRQEQGRPHFQAGVRYWIVPQRVQIDTTYGDRLGGAGAQQWFSIGLRLITPPF